MQHEAVRCLGRTENNFDWAWIEARLGCRSANTENLFTSYTGTVVQRLKDDAEDFRHIPAIV